MLKEFIRDHESFLEVDTPDWSAEIILSVGSIMLELNHKKSGLNLLRKPESIEQLKSKPEVYGFPVLIPPNCIYHGKFFWRGRNYYLPVNTPYGNHIHGVVLNRKWTLSASGNDEGFPFVETTYNYDQSNEMFPGYPHKFQVRLRYVFRKEEVIQRLSVCNLSSETMPFAAGFHSAFDFPLGEKTTEAYAESKVYVTTAPYYWKFDRKERFAVTGEKMPWNTEDDFIHGKKINKEPVSKQAPIISTELCGMPFRGAILESPVSHLRICYRWDEKYTQTALWNWDGQMNFFCPEPMSWIADSPNLPMPDSETGLYPLKPGETWSAENQIFLQEC